MSKKKKMTIEELLEEALVSEDEKPFEVPSNWMWVKSEHIAKWGSGGTPSRKKLEYYNGNIPWLKTGELRDTVVFDSEEKITEEALEKSSAKLFPKGSIAIAMYGATIGRLAILGIDAATNQACAVGYPNLLTNKNYMFFYYLSQRNNLIELGKGGAQPNISQTLIKEFPYPLPPINEQKRIAEKAERLLNKIEEAMQLIGEAKETYELRKSAIIRTILQEGIDEDSLTQGWKKEKIKDVFTIFGGGTPSKAKSEYWNGDIPWISAKDMKTTFIHETMDYITENGLKNSSAKLAQKGSIVMVVRSGILQRTLPIAYLLTGCTVNQDLKVFDSGNDLINKYFLWYVKGNEKHLLYNYSKSGTTVNSIEFEKFKTHQIIIPPLDVLKRKIEKIENTIEREGKVNEILNLTETIEYLKSSILSKVFRGEFGTNDPNEENAIELLKEVLKEKL